MDVGTEGFKLGVFGPDLERRCEATRRYEVNLYDQGKADIETGKWWQALRECCAEVQPYLDAVRVVSFSVTTPGLLPMAEDGTALGPAILFFDRRSNAQAAEIRRRVGDDKFLRETLNLPVSGGSSLCSILWIRDNQPEVWRQAHMFGHTNTYMGKRFTGNWGIDPSTTSITGMYNSARHDLTWNTDVLSAAEIPLAKLPPLMQSYDKVGDIRPEVARELGLSTECEVLCGGNDAVLAALSGGLTAPGDINNINGTCEITNVCVDRPVYSPNFNIRCHVIPQRWVTFFVLNTGGIAMEWFHSRFCQEMSEQEFFTEYVPEVIHGFLSSDRIDAWDASLPKWTPYLQGSRYSLEPLTAGFSGLRLETTREDMLLGLLKGNALYEKTHLDEVAGMSIEMGNVIMTSGGVSKIKHFLPLKKRWTGNFEFRYQDQSSLLGAAMLGQFYLTGQYADALKPA
ncbi:MAG: hypothetical protein JXA74_13900 [Anaerolineae bacterium]|nr:hypothetical protein [Anaerolineae bacterium]